MATKIFGQDEMHDQNYFISLTKYIDKNDKHSLINSLKQVIIELKQELSNDLDIKKNCIEGYSYKNELIEIINYHQSLLKNIDELYNFYCIIKTLDE